MRVPTSVVVAMLCGIGVLASCARDDATRIQSATACPEPTTPDSRGEPRNAAGDIRYCWPGEAFCHCDQDNDCYAREGYVPCIPGPLDAGTDARADVATDVPLDRGVDAIDAGDAGAVTCPPESTTTDSHGEPRNAAGDIRYCWPWEAFCHCDQDNDCYARAGYVACSRIDAGTDARSDVAVDSGIDVRPDTATDTGNDARVDTGFDAPTDSGTTPCPPEPTTLDSHGEPRNADGDIRHCWPWEAFCHCDQDNDCYARAGYVACSSTFDAGTDSASDARADAVDARDAVDAVDASDSGSADADAGPPPPPTAVDILTFHGDNARTGWNRRETILTPANVRPETFGLLAVSPDVNGEVAGSPLFASALTVRDTRLGVDATRDVLFVNTLNNRLFALAGNTLQTLWSFDFEGHAAPYADELSTCQSHWRTGSMSTPVISADRSLIYVVGRTSDAGGPYFLGYAIRTRDGSIAARFRVGEYLGADGVTRTPLTYDGYHRGALVHATFENRKQNQRGALLLVGNTLYITIGGTCSVPGYRGWIFGYDVTSLSERARPVATFLPVPGGGAGVWSVTGASSDGTSVFVTSGNGRASLRVDSTDPMRSFGDAVMRLSPALALDHHACFDVASPTAACGTEDRANLRNVFMPRHAELLGRDQIADNDSSNDTGSPDLDLGITGPLLLPSASLAENQGIDDGRRLTVAAGKDGFVYLIDRDRMGGVGPSRLTSDADIPNLIGAELHSLMLSPSSASGGVRSAPAYFEGHSGRYLFTVGSDVLAGRADAPHGLAALRLTRVVDPTPAACAALPRTLNTRNVRIPCATIWGSISRPGLEVAWSGSGPLAGGSPFVSSNGADSGIVWVTFERGSNGNGLLQAYAAESVASVADPIYRSDANSADRVPGNATTFASPIVANGRVYVTGSTFVAMYGLRPNYTPVPPPPAPPPVPDCEPGVSWESFGRGFMAAYCTNCHAEYTDLGFTRGRRDRVADAIWTAMGAVGSMPPNREGMVVPMPTDGERRTIANWLRCGAPAMQTRFHSGFEIVAAPNGAWEGDADFIDATRPGTLSADRLMGASVVNAFAPDVPDALFAIDRVGATRYRVPVPGAGRYDVRLYVAENACLSGSTTCRDPFDVSIGGAPWLSGFDVYAAAGGARRVVGRATTVTLTSTNTLLMDVSNRGKVHAIEVVRIGD